MPETIDEPTPSFWHVHPLAKDSTMHMTAGLVVHLHEVYDDLHDHGRAAKQAIEGGNAGISEAELFVQAMRWRGYEG